MNFEQISQLPEATPGQRIKKLRLTAGLSQSQLSRQLGFTANYFGQVERDRKELSKNLADALCRYFHVDYSYLYHGNGIGEISDTAVSGSSRELLTDYIRSCSEEECRLLEPVIRAIIQSLRSVGWFPSN